VDFDFSRDATWPSLVTGSRAPNARCLAQTQESLVGASRGRRHDRELSVSRSELIAVHAHPRGRDERDLAIGEQSRATVSVVRHASWWELRDRCLTSRSLEEERAGCWF
jgi:hypothetical protein